MDDIISITINLDSRPGFMEETSSNDSGKLISGTRSLDYFIDGVLNKIKFFDGHEKEVTVVVDVHEPLPDATEKWLLDMQKNGTISNLVFNKHIETYLEMSYCPKWHDLNYLNTLILAKGKYLVHFDSDMVAFINDRSVVNEWLQWLDEGKYDYISYPSNCSPNPCFDRDFDYAWASTRFFICKREIIDYTEIMKCLMSSEYLYGKYGDRKRKCPWLEHVLALIGGPAKVFYPPVELNRYSIFSWSRYHTGILKKLTEMPYEKVIAYVSGCGGISFPCDVAAQRIK